MTESDDLATLPATDPPLPDGECHHYLELPYFSVGGITGPRTMKIRGRLQDRDIILMINSGASHNFISDDLARELALPFKPSPAFTVCLGDGRRRPTQGQCQAVTLTLGACAVTADFYIFGLGGLDAILGVAWLQTLGDVRVNWATMTMHFQPRPISHCLTGDSTLLQTRVSFRALQRTSELWPLQLVPEAEPAPPPEDLRHLLHEFAELFEAPSGLPPIRHTDHAIVLQPGTSAVSVRPYRYRHVQKDEIERLVQEMLLGGIIWPSASPFSSPVLLVRKKDGSWRFCVDYRELNKATVSDKYPIPVIQELLDELHDAIFFTKLDLRAGYHQIRVRPADVLKMAFRTHDGHFEFLEHLQHVRSTLLTLRRHHLVLNRKKCTFGETKVSYLGHTIAANGVAMDEDKIMAVLRWPTPTSVREVRAFLGLTGYYRRFIQGYDTLARPLTQLLKTSEEGPFSALVHGLVLAMPDFHQPFVMECDASGVGVGAVLMQVGRPIAYYSRGFSSSIRSRSAYENELMALVLAVQHWHPYLLGRPFVVRTDHHSLRYLLLQKIVTPAQQLWAAKLLGYDFSIEFRSGKTNRAADALSRQPHAPELAALTRPVWEEGADIQEGVERDPVLGPMRTALIADPSAHSPYSLIGGRLFYRGRLVQSASSTCIPRLLKEFHASPSGGHAGAFRTCRRLLVLGADVSTAVYGLPPPSIVRHLPGECPVASLAAHLQDRDIILNSLKQHLRRAQAKMTSFANRKRRDLQFAPGEKVFIKLHPYRQLTVARRACPKLAPRFFGPFEVLGRIGAVAYRLRLPDGSRIHPVFHVSQLRCVIGDHPALDHIPADLDFSGLTPLYPAAILDSRSPHPGTGSPEEVRVAWRHRPLSASTWLLRDDFRRQFPDYCLEDKANFPDGGIVTELHDDEPPWRVYARRPRTQKEGGGVGAVSPDVSDRDTAGGSASSGPGESHYEEQV
ncbi:hypothetical protein KSP39_PZI011094 [Platanthera zijinensis]|uniref:RNA-directed DNA polymerase n=1 Tax=Platanthera zijinensis TaxID=2320716 RepID=A0AAP0G5K8_9ASPA